MFICLFVCLYFCLFVLIIVGHPQKGPPKILWRSNLIRLRYLGSKNVYLFICFFVCLFVQLFVFYFNLLRTPTRIYPENFAKIPLDLAEILRIRKLDWKMFICLFICLFVYIFVGFFALLIVEYPKEVSLKISWRSDLIWLRYYGLVN